MSFQICDTERRSINMSASYITAVVAMIFFIVPDIVHAAIWINEKGEYCWSGRKAGSTCRPATEQDRQKVAENRGYWENEKFIERCNFGSSLLSFNEREYWSKQEKKMEEGGRSEYQTYLFVKPSYDDAVRDLAKQQYLSSEVVRNAASNKEMYGEMLRDSQLKISLFRQCARFANLRAGGSSKEDALREIGLR